MEQASSGLDTTQPDWLVNHVPAPNPGNPNWKKGISGNPAGRPPGRTPQQKLVKKMMDEGGEVLDAVLANAKAGDAATAAIILNLIIPALRSQSQTVQFQFDPSLPIARQVEQVLAAVAAGEVPPDVGQTIVAMINALGNVRAVETLEERLTMLEAKVVS